MAFISIPTSIDGVNIPGQMGRIASGPLSVLFNGRGVNTKKYPLDLGTDAAKMHYVQFSVSEVIPASYQDAGGTTPGSNISMGGYGGIANAAGSGISASVTEINNMITPQSVSSFYSNIPGVNSSIAKSFDNIMPGGLASASYDASRVVAKTTNWIGDVLTKGVSISPKTKKLGAVISLYMPDTLYAEYSADYTEFSLTDDLGGLVSSIRAVNQIADKNPLSGPSGSMYEAIKSVGKGMGNAVSNQPETIYLASKAFGAENIGAVLNKAQGYAINPQLQMIYKGIGLRTFQLTFTFTPKSAQEAKEVDDIIALFKHHYAPRLESATETSINSMFFIPPSMFTVQFMHNGRENVHLPKYGECVLSHITIDYAPNGFAAYEDGAPVQSQLMLQFQEIEIIDQNKLDKGVLR